MALVMLSLWYLSWTTHLDVERCLYSTYGSNSSFFNLRSSDHIISAENVGVSSGPSKGNVIDRHRIYKF